jgi:hypothetical protein
MPVSAVGQLITFAIEKDEDQRFRRWIWVDLKTGDTVARLAARRGHPEDVSQIKKQNGIRSASKVLLHHPRRKGDRTKLRVPGELRASASFDVLAGDQPPRIIDGYAKFSVEDRPERVGLTRFDGYNPMVMEVPVRFEAGAMASKHLGLPSMHGAHISGGTTFVMHPSVTLAGRAKPKGPQPLVSTLRTGNEVERDCLLLERMAGRGNFHGAAVGQPPVIRVSTTNASGLVIPLIPENYQWSRANPAAHLWRVAGIEWDSDPWRDGRGQRIRQLATVTLQQHTRVALATRSVTHRRRGKGPRGRGPGVSTR